MRRVWLLLVILLFAQCKPGRKVNTSFYYWKTVYKQNNTENAYLQHLHSNRLYVRIMDVDMDESGANPVPVSPVVFEDKLPDTVAIIPVVFVVNNVLRNISKTQLDGLAGKIVHFVDGKVKQAGKATYPELQIDCDWTAQTRDNYFYLLNKLWPLLSNKKLSATLRLYQVKNQRSCGIPPVNKVMLMCYNMGNLRKYGNQNSIIDVNELKKYLNDNLSNYRLPMDIGLPLFSWAVAFRDKNYMGIARQLNFAILNDQHKFMSQGDNLYRVIADMPGLGLRKDDVIRWESAPLADLHLVAEYLAGRIKADTINVIWFHLDETVLTHYKYAELENIGYLLR